MDKKTAILAVVVFCLLCVGSYMIFDPAKNLSYHEINLTNSCSASVPVTDKNSTYVDNLNINYYEDYENNLNITAFNNESIETASQGLLRFNNIKDEVLGDEKMTEGNFTYYKNARTGDYTIFIEDRKSHNFILISSEDLTILNKVYNSLKATVVVGDSSLETGYSNSYDSGNSYSSNSYSGSGNSYSSNSYSSSGSSYSSGNSYDSSSSYDSGSSYSSGSSYDSGSSYSSGSSTY